MTVKQSIRKQLAEAVERGDEFTTSLLCGQLANLAEGEARREAQAEMRDRVLRANGWDYGLAEPMEPVPIPAGAQPFRSELGRTDNVEWREWYTVGGRTLVVTRDRALNDQITSWYWEGK